MRFPGASWHFPTQLEYFPVIRGHFYFRLPAKHAKNAKKEGHGRTRTDTDWNENSREERGGTHSILLIPTAEY